jgi:hypothetical protein
LKDTDISETFQADVGGTFAALIALEEDINSRTENMKNVLVQSATEIQGKKKKTNKPWITDDILNLVIKDENLNINQNRTQKR